MQDKKLNRRLDVGMPARIKQVSYPQLFLRSSLTRFLGIVGGLLLAATLLIPVFWIPGLVVLVLPTEVYLLDWVHSKYSKSLDKKSLFDLSNEAEYLFSHTERQRTTRRRAEAERRRTSIFVR
jgi:hypothetical protein